MKASELLWEYKQASLIPTRDKIRRDGVKWSPPDEGTVKVNVDAGRQFEGKQVRCRGRGEE